MSRIGRDYIWEDERQRRLPRLRWIVVTLALPLIVGAIGMGRQDAAESAPDTRKTTAGDFAVPFQAAAGVVPKPLVETPTIFPDTAGQPRPATKKPSEAKRVAIPMPDTAGSPPSSAAAEALPAEEPAAAEPEWTDVEIERGDTLSLAFQRHDLSYRDSLAIAHLDEHGKRFTRGLKAGDTLHVRADDEGRVLAVDYPLDPVRTLEVRKEGDGYAAGIVDAEVESRTAYAVGTIDTSFYVDALEAGMSDKLIMNLAHIFGWDIDFVLDIREGDRFIVVYEELYRDGEKIRDGKILAAEFTNRGRELRALHYTDANSETAYYAPDGDAMKKAFIRTPLDQFRISSHFSRGRKHPVLNRIRKHEGTDYAAPNGTSIKATGNGRIVFRGRKGGYGNTVIIKHNDRYSTRYAHMSRFASGQGIGTQVEQGEVIGYVGMTGLATGPHLHYEFRVNGAPRNPETVDLPEAEPIPEGQLADFRRQVQPLMAQIDALDRIQLARNDAE